MIQSFNRIQKIVIANRSEIAARIQATAQRLGIKTVVLYTQAEAHLPHLRNADEIYQLSQSGNNAYLNQQEIIRIALIAGADAVHPGYGFLSENHTFAHAVLRAGLIWIGPTPELIEQLGSKAGLREIATKNAIPTVPGFTLREDISYSTVATQAAKIGYPVVIKASAGGGGKGIEVAWEEAELAEKISRVQSIGTRLFNNKTCIIEKYIEKPRHIEVQIAGDGTSVLYLLDRECSLQRNNQKIIETAPALSLSPETKEKLAHYALSLGKAVSYNSLGTVEFIVTQSEEIYLLEVNTRLQVEHTVTEQILNRDLVALQLLIAEHNRLPYTQHDIVSHGYAIQCRLNSEQPEHNFLPSTGTIQLLSLPHLPFCRLDHSLAVGTTVDGQFDAMIAKLITWGNNREEARLTMHNALQRHIIGGITTNQSFLLFLLTHKLFKADSLHTQLMPTLMHEFNQYSTEKKRSQAGTTLLEKARQQLHRHSQSKPKITTEKTSWWKAKKWK